MRRIGFFLIGIFLVSCSGNNHSESVNSTFARYRDAVSGWEYRIGSSPLDSDGNPVFAYSDEAQDKWKPLKYPKLLKRHNEKEAWMRIKLPVDNWINPAIYIEGVYLAFEIYSGKDVIYRYGSRQAIDNNDIIAPKWQLIVPLKKEHLGKYLSFRLYSHWHIGILGSIKVGEKTDLFAYLVRKDLDKIILCALFFVLGLINLLAFCQHTKQRIYLYFGLTVLSMIGIGMFYSGIGKMLYSNPIFWLHFRFISMVVFIVFFFLFLENFFGSGYKKWIRRYWQFCGILAVTTIILFSINMSFFKFFYITNAFVFLLGNALIAILAIYRAIYSDRESRLFSIGAIFFILTSIYDYLQGNAVIPWSRLYSGWGTLIFFAFLTAILSRRFSTVYVQLQQYSKELEKALSKLENHSETINRQFLDSIHIIYSLIASSSSRIYEDTNECTQISVMLAKKIGMSADEIENIRIAAMLHHLGLVGLVERLMRTKSRLTDDEIRLLKMHPQKSVEIIENLTGSDKISKIILQHHERFDGSGYPLGLKKNDIILGAQVIGLVDDFIFLRRKRDFQSFDKHNKVIAELKTYSGIFFDEMLVQGLVELIDEENLIYIANESDIKIDVFPDTMVWKIPSNINFEPIIADRVVKEVQRRTGMANDLVYAMDYSLSEVVRNAIVHGNRYNENKIVTIELTTTIENGANKAVIQISDEGEGMDIKEHDKFFKSRKELAGIIEKLNQLKTEPEMKEKITQIISHLNKFRLEYYMDYNAFRQIEGTELTGGIGLIHVLSFFDNVKFSNIIINSQIKGFQVTLTKTI